MKTLLQAAAICLIVAGSYSPALYGQTQPTLTLTWDRIDDPRCVKYIVKRALTAAAANAGIPDFTVEVVAPPFTDTVKPNSRYYYWVAGIDVDGVEGYSSNRVLGIFQQPAMPRTFTLTSIASPDPEKLAYGAAVEPVTKYSNGELIPATVKVEYLWYMAIIQEGEVTNLFAITEVPNVQKFDIPKNSSLYFYVTSRVGGVESRGSSPIRLST